MNYSFSQTTDKDLFLHTTTISIYTVYEKFPYTANQTGAALITNRCIVWPGRSVWLVWIISVFSVTDHQEDLLCTQHSQNSEIKSSSCELSATWSSLFKQEIGQSKMQNITQVAHYISDPLGNICLLSLFKLYKNDKKSFTGIFSVKFFGFL